MAADFIIDDEEFSMDEFADGEPSEEEMAFLVDQNQGFLEETDPLAEEFNFANPIKQQSVPIHKDKYPPNDNQNDYGYDELAAFAPLRAAINSYSTKLGIPGQWMADILYFQSKFQPHRQQDGRVGILGWNPRTVTEMGTTPEELVVVKPEKQMAYVYQYMDPFKEQFRTIEDVFMLVYGGPDRLKLGLKERGRVGTGGPGTGFPWLIKQLGREVGRLYATNYSTPGPIHTTYVDGCLQCMSMAEFNNGEILPHQGTRQ